VNVKGKYLITLVIAAALLVLIKGIPADAYVGSVFTYTYNNQTITYKVLSEPTVNDNGTAQVIYADGINEKLTKEVIIPPTVTNKLMTYTVTRIGSDAFTNADKVTSISLPSGITYIGDNAFRDCTSLVRVNIPSGVTAIADDTFYGCKSLIGLYLPEGVTSIGNSAFTDCSKLIGINIPQGVKKIGTSAFSGCSSLTSINIPDGVTHIENRVFKDCTNLAAVNLPETITSIGMNAFYSCEKLKEIHLSDEITSIGEYAFYNCGSLTSIKIPYKVTKIENRVFLLCTKLSSIRIEGKVTNIGDFAFYGCSSLINVSIPDSVTNIGDYAFYGCDNLRPLRIPRGVSSIGVGEFPYTGVLVYKNSYAESFFAEKFPNYYQIIQIPLEEMSFAEEVKGIGINESLTLKPVFYPAEATDIAGTIKWTSSDPEVLSVDGNGAIRGLRAGEADLTAVMGNFKAVCHIVVGGIGVNPTSITIAEKNLIMNKGEAKKLHWSFAPAETTNRSIKWISSDTSVVTVDNGHVFAKNPGTATIRAESGGVFAECKITVYNPLKDIYSDYNAISLNKGETKKLAVSLEPYDTTEDKTILWNSEDESIATVTNGVLKAVKPGNTRVRATVGTLTYTISVSVLAPVKTLSFSKAAVELTSGQKLTVPLTVLPEDTTDKVLITSSDPFVSDYSDGAIIAKKSGKATITAVCGSLTTTVTVTVNTDIQSIKLNKTNVTLYLGSATSQTVTFSPAKPADDKTITWTSSNPAVVKGDSKGEIKAVGTGTATLTATAGGKRKAVCTVTVKLGVPSSVKAVSPDYNSSKITWGAVSGASGYQLYCASSKTGTYTLVKDTTAKSFTHRDLTSGTNYYYKVRAYLNKGTAKVYGSYSPVVSVQPIPSVPVNGKLKKVSTGRVEFTWGKVKGASGYEVYRSSTKTKTYSRVTTTSSQYFINFGLTKGRTYSYKVRAYRIVGNKKVYSKFTKVYSVKI
jgi:uncharacterized protein YjdB